LFFQTWEKPQSEATLLITHGLGEHSGSYFRLVEALKDLPITIIGWDLRGHGKSEGRRGYVEHFNEFTQDMFCLLKQVDRKKPLITLGHSMGGLVQLKTLIDHPELAPKAQILSSPMLGLAAEVPFHKHYLALAANSFANTLTLDSELHPVDLSRDPDVQKSYDHDHLRHDRVSPGIYMGFLNSTEYVLSRAEKIQIPSYFQVAGKDKLVNAEKAQSFYNKISVKNKKMYFYPDSVHELYNDLNREEVYSDFKEILEKISKIK
jgi:alpha-beta hydrolase superfamily lysophospholipase